MPPPSPLLSLIIPCYNEEEGIPQLVGQLAALRVSFAPDKKNPSGHPNQQPLQRYQLEIIFVDDGSTDKTNELLHQHYGNDPHVIIATHEQNKNLGAALKTGFQHSSGELIATWDSDCTYPLLLLPTMLEAMNKGEGKPDEVDLVTASPYHPLGKVENVPAYRLVLSKGASWIYRFLLGSGLYTHNALVRLYKREVLQNVTSKADDFLYIPEILIKALLQGYRVKEVPATLRMRRYGTSKIKLLSTIGSHLSLMGRIVLYRIGGRGL